MSKLVDIETIRKKIELRKEKYFRRGEESDRNHDGKGMYWGGVISTLNEVLTMLDTLPEADPVDLDEEMTAFIENHYHIRNDETLEIGNDPLTVSDFEEIARHFYELGKKIRYGNITRGHEEETL